MASSRHQVRNKLSMIAIKDMERLGINPIEMMKVIHDRALEAFDKHRGDNEKSDAGSSYLSVAGQMAMGLAKFKHPTLSAMAVKDITDDDSRDVKPMTTQEAMQVMRDDPFAPEDLQDITSDQVVDAMNSAIAAPLLPGGKSEN